MIQTLILRGIDPPYLIVRVVPSLFHVTVLPAHLREQELMFLGRAQVRANGFDACLVLAARHGLALPADGAEHRVADVPFARFNHWSSAPVIGRLQTASPLPITDGSLRRQARLEAAVGAFAARRAELLQRGMLPVAPYLLGDPTKAGREATPAERQRLAGRQGDGVPVGLVPCAHCGGWRGECLDPNPSCHGQVVRVQYRCENHNRCARCSAPFDRFRLNANHYDAGLDVIVHVPGLCALTHACARPDGRRGPPGSMDDLRALVGICYDADTRERFVAWLRSVRPPTGDLAVMVVEMALRHTPVGAQGQDRYVLVGFQPDGEPVVDLRAVS